ncbi:unnamed protein product [Moneuplotes crassus]|uniref:Uncharacterized protein n=1 Tax=Euplotes crassus TaxID=5936 RepID=A0AAD1Y6J4_EUPCR|nr:unnamed protein product [Moneuplotes crassus]
MIQRSKRVDSLSEYFSFSKFTLSKTSICSFKACISCSFFSFSSGALLMIDHLLSLPPLSSFLFFLTFEFFNI